MAVLAFGVSMFERLLPERFKESDYGLQLFVLREFGTELKTFGIAGLIAFVFWDQIASFCERVLSSSYRALQNPRGIYGEWARRASIAAILLTLAVVVSGAFIVGQQALYFTKVNYVYLRDKAASKYQSFLWREARVAQAGMDYVTTSRILEQITKHFPEDARAKAELVYGATVIATSERIGQLGKASIARYGASPEGLGLLAEAFAMHPRSPGLREEVEQVLEQARAHNWTINLVDCTAQGQEWSPNVKADRTVERRAISVLVEPGDRGAFSSPKTWRDLLRRSCDSGEADVLWQFSEIEAMLGQLGAEGLAARAADYRLVLEMRDRERSGEVLGEPFE